MKNFIIIVSILLVLSADTSARPFFNALNKSPLENFSSKWNDNRYNTANTAAAVTYMTATEKQVIYILNLVRMDPILFLNSVVVKYPDYKGRPELKNNRYFKSLVSTLLKTKALTILTPNLECYESAYCHAQSTGKTGYTGHDRQSNACKKNMFYYGECISYGYNDPLEIVMSLLIDENVPSLGHRNIFLADYKSAGVSIQPHRSTYNFTAVLDFAY